MTTIRLGDVCRKIGSGATPRGGQEVYLDAGEIALIRSQNVYNESFERTGLVYLTAAHAKQLDNVTVQTGDVLLNITGDSVARACQVPADVLPARVNQHVAIIRPDPDLVDPRFLRFYLASPQMQQHMLLLAGAGATRNALTKGMIENFQIPDIPIKHQRAIGIALGVFEDKIDRNRKTNATLEAAARTLFREWFVEYGPVRSKVEGVSPLGVLSELVSLFPGELDDDGTPVGWTRTNLSEIAEPRGKGVLPTDVSAHTPYIGLEHMPRRCIALSSWEGAGKVTSNKSRFSEGDILFGKLRPYFHKVGVAPVDGICSTDIIVLGPKVEAWNAFVLMCVSSDEFVAYTDRTSNGTKMPRTSWDAMSRYPLTLPEEPLASGFNDIVQPMIETITANVLESKALTKMLELLLPRIVSGEAQISDIEKLIEAAE
ncbi:restriction endonuclease subunit S [uncultured Pseudomonas sp.]|uniref:restriction endonuclease subunit S n=1 Tax=uncultured Pseudomonas sp. TaxID=114707 RepID=UPI00258A9211|nr:restriction endonuclease subunit S [uncultured Pseudomonas sp.]